MHDISALLRKLIAAIAKTEPHFAYNDNSWDEWVCLLCQASAHAIYNPPGRLNAMTMAELDHEEDCPWHLMQSLIALGVDGFLATTDESLVSQTFLRERYVTALENLTAMAGKANEEFGLPEVEDEWRTDVENMVRGLEAMAFEADRAHNIGVVNAKFGLWHAISQILNPKMTATPVFLPEQDYGTRIVEMVTLLHHQAEALFTIMRARGDDLGYLLAMRHAYRATTDPSGHFLNDDEIASEAEQAGERAIENLPDIEPGARRSMIAIFADAWEAAYRRGRDEILARKTS